MATLGLPRPVSEKTVENHKIFPPCVYSTPPLNGFLLQLSPPVSDVASRQHLRSASRRLLVVLRHRLSTYDAGLLPSLARRPGTLSWIISGIRTLLWTTWSACWKRFCSQGTSAISALDVSRRCALQIYILLTYLLTEQVLESKHYMMGLPDQLEQTNMIGWIILKIHWNNQFLLSVNVSVSIRDLHQKNNLVLVLLVLGTTRTWTWLPRKRSYVWLSWELPSSQFMDWTLPCGCIRSPCKTSGQETEPVYSYNPGALTEEGVVPLLVCTRVIL